jgi:alpha-glucosidase
LIEDKQQAEWWREAVIYQVYPRSFQDTSGDGVGDIEGIIQRLPEIKSLGVDTIWVSPFFKSPMKDFGYDVTDHCSVDPLFGTLENARELIKSAHQQGLKLLIDLVISHTSDQHPWFKESRLSQHNDKSDHYVWADPLPDGSPPTNWLSIFGGSAWQWDTRRCQYYLHNFLTSQPDLNFHNTQVQEEVLKVVDFWLELGVDGFRLDTVNFYYHDQQLRNNPPASVRDQMSAHETNPYGWQDHIFDKNQPEVVDFIEQLRARLDCFDDRISLGEIGESPVRSLDLLVNYTAPGRLHLCYSFDLLSSFGDAPYWREVIDRFEQKAKLSGHNSWPCWAFSNHDVTRAASRLCPEGGDIQRSGSLLMALLLSLRGTPCIYQGEELALPEVEVPYESLVDPYGIEFWPAYKGRDGCRTPYPWSDQHHGGFSKVKPWLPMTKEHLERSFERQEKAHTGPLHNTRLLLNLRAEQRALRRGDIQVIESDPPLLIFERSLKMENEEAQTVLCVFNPTIRPHHWEVVVDTLGPCLLSSDHLINDEDGLLLLPPQSWAFFGQSPLNPR